MPNAHRFALSALLVVGSAVLAGLVVAASTPRYAGGSVPPAAMLPWPLGVQRAVTRPPFVLLYVDSHCAHCSRAAVLADSIAAARGLRAVIATRDDQADAEAYARRLGLHSPLTVDTLGRLLRAIGTRAVPTLVLFHADGSRELIVGFTRDARYRAALVRLEQ